MKAASRQGLEDSAIPIETLREQWALQTASQTAPMPRKSSIRHTSWISDVN